MGQNKMKKKPGNITTEIVRDYPGRFVLEQVELERLLKDIQRLLKPEDEKQNLKFRYWVGLANGVVYETDELDLVLHEENAQSLTIVLFILFAELTDQDETLLRRIVVHFSRAQPSTAEDALRLPGDEWLNLKYRGLSYRVKDRDRDSALEIISTLEERLNKFRRWYSSCPDFSMSPRRFARGYVLFLTYTLLVYASSTILPAIADYSSVRMPRGTLSFVREAALGMLVFAIIAALAVGVLWLIDWIVPPSVIAIGDEIENYRKQKKLREMILWGILIAAVVGLVVNYLSAQWF